MGRNIRTRVDVMKPVKWSHEVDPKKDQMARHFNKRNGGRYREFERDDPVYYVDRDGPNHHCWTEATVTARVGYVMYEIRKSNGKIVKAHVNQLRERHMQDMNDENQWMILNETFDLPVEKESAQPRNVVSSPIVSKVPSVHPSPINQPSPIAQPSPRIQNSPPKADIRRSSRSRQAPRRLIEEM